LNQQERTIFRQTAHTLANHALERFRAKLLPVRVKKTHQIKNLEPRFDSIETEKALAHCLHNCCHDVPFPEAAERFAPHLAAKGRDASVP
jgi:hypothetical protein